MANTAETIKNSWNAVTHGWQATQGNRGVLASAVIFDLLSAIPWVGMIFSFLGYLTIWLVLEIKGISASLFSRGASKKIAAIAGEFIAGVFGFGIVPGITVWAFFTVTDDEVKEEGNESTINKINLPQHTSRTKTSLF